MYTQHLLCVRRYTRGSVWDPELSKILILPSGIYQQGPRPRPSGWAQDGIADLEMGEGKKRVSYSILDAHTRESPKQDPKHRSKTASCCQTKVQSQRWTSSRTDRTKAILFHPQCGLESRTPEPTCQVHILTLTLFSGVTWTS